MAGTRTAYEAEVRALELWGADALAGGRSIESVACEAVDRRNALKCRYRQGMDPTILQLLEWRNLRKYGDPVGPDAGELFRRYGSWEAVLAAACRPARLADG